MFTCADEEDEFMGSLSLCSIDQDHDENCDVTAIDKFHGLRVAHPLEARAMRQGITVGRDASCGLVLGDPTVGGRQQHIVRSFPGPRIALSMGLCFCFLPGCYASSCM